MGYFIIMLLASLFALVHLIQHRNNFAKVLVIGQVVAIAVTLLSLPKVKQVGLVLFILTLLVAIVYALTTRGLELSKRSMISISAFLVLLVHVFQLQHWPGAGVLGLTMIVPVFVFVMIVVKGRRSFHDELGFMAVIAAAAFVELLIRIRYMAL